MTNLKDLTLDELKIFVENLGEASFRAAQIFGWMYKGAADFDAMPNIPKALREKLRAVAYISSAKVARRLESELDGTVKYLFRLADGKCVESVLMRYKHGNSVCVSTQVGCRMNCRFCASSGRGLARNLSCGEIVDQILAIKADSGERISNVVLMGIGEPLDNFDNVVKFLNLASSQDALGIGQRHISLSTCGLVPKIMELARLKPQITLSISLHAATDETRNIIMPINKKYNIAELLGACKSYINLTGRRISFEYILIDNLNDSAQDAKMLAKLLRGMLCHVNLIEANEVPGSDLRPSKNAPNFLKILENAGITATIRRKMGRDIDAACGQLRARNLNE
jgi:23S rRNA (adenine2503-C2)-methyltransferase